MRQVFIGGNELMVYDGIDEMPMENYHKFNRLLIFEAGLSPDAEGLVRQIWKAHGLIETGAYEKAMDELANMQQAVNMAVSEVSPVGMAFAATVYSVNGRVVDDLSDDALRRLSNMLCAEKVGTLRKLVAGLKKKLTASCRSFSGGSSRTRLRRGARSG